jgi:2-polyprenyl-3-methyl-5-hydroxy-6-metoxy-1,4-benzoquinol methylase
MMDTQEKMEGWAMATRETTKDLTADKHVCPWWMGYLLCCPLRRLLENPEKILGPHVHPGMKVVEPGCGMGFFSLPLARMVGPQGRVICVDIQRPMITRLLKRARKAGLDDRIEAHVCLDNDLGLQQWRGAADLVTAIHVIHEAPDASAFLRQVQAVLKPPGRLLILEPRGHVTSEAFQLTLERARQAGFSDLEPPRLRGERTALLERK